MQQLSHLIFIEIKNLSYIYTYILYRENLIYTSYIFFFVGRVLNLICTLSSLGPSDTLLSYIPSTHLCHSATQFYHPIPMDNQIYMNLDMNTSVIARRSSRNESKLQNATCRIHALRYCRKFELLFESCMAYTNHFFRIRSYVQNYIDAIRHK